MVDEVVVMNRKDELGEGVGGKDGGYETGGSAQMSPEDCKQDEVDAGYVSFFIPDYRGPCRGRATLL